MKTSTNYAVTDNHVIIAKGSKRAMMRKRADLSKGAYEKGMANFDSRYHVYFAMTQPVGHDFNK